MAGKEATIENSAQESLEAESAKISTVETILLVTISLMGDFADIVGALFIAIPYIGQVVYFLAKAFSWFIWALIMIWAFFRGATGQAVIQRILTMSAGKVLDELTFGIIPFQTVALVLTIYLNNKGASGGVVGKIAGKALKATKRF